MATIENFILRFKTEGTAGIQSARDSINGLGKDVGGLNGALGRLGGGMAGLGRSALGLAGGIAGVGAAIAAMGLKAIESADQIQDMSDATGISSSKLLSLKQSLIEAGGDAGTMEKVASKLTVAIGDAANGSVKAGKTFEQLGVYILDSAGNIRDSNDILDETLQALANIEDPARRSALAVELLGKEAAKIDWTNVRAGKDAVSDEQIKTLAKYRGELDTLRNTIETKMIQAFGNLAEAVNKGGFLEYIAALTEEMGRLISYIPGLGGVGKLVDKARMERLGERAGAGRGGMGGPTAAELRAFEQTQAGGATGGRFRGVSEAEIKAAAESEKRIRESAVATRLQQDLRAENEATAIALKGSNERIAIDEQANSQIRTLAIQARAEAAKAIETINSNTELSATQKTKEIAAKETEIYTKMATDVSKIRQKQSDDIEKINRQRMVREAQMLMDQLDEDSRAWAQYYQNIDQAQLAAFQQTDSLRLANEELRARLGLQKQIDGLTSIDADRAQALFQAERNRLEELRRLEENKNLPVDDKKRKEEEINRLFRERIGLINEEYDTRTKREEDWGAGFQDAMLKYKDSFTAFKQGGMVADSLFSNMSRSIDNFVNTGKFKFGDFARSIIQDLIRIEMKAIASYFIRMILGQFFTAGAYGTTPFSQQTSMLMAQEAGMGLPGRAAGGPVQSGMGYIVGERGPELFIPKTSGNIIPNNQLQTTPSVTNINYSISAVDASSFRSLVARDPQFIYSVTEKGRRSLPSRRMAV